MKDELSTMFIMRKDALAAVYGAWLQETVTGGAAQTGLDGNSSFIWWYNFYC